MYLQSSSSRSLLNQRSGSNRYLPSRFIKDNLQALRFLFAAGHSLSGVSGVSGVSGGIGKR